MFNKLLSRPYRANCVAQGQVIDEDRCSGRTTASVLSTMANAINNPGQWITVVDHYSGGIANGDRVANEVMSIAARLELKFFEKRIGRHGPKGVTGPVVYQVRCDMFTNNQWSIV